MEETGEEGIAGFSVKTLLTTAIGILLFSLYVWVLVYGENSVMVLDKLQEKKSKLKLEQQVLKSENQRLQKEYFELRSEKQRN
jgi:cell division protein FtsB